jgi:hypothetical protein
MPTVISKSNKPLYLNIFPSWKGRQPVAFFMMENLLEARLGSPFPTNGAGPDEDVNVFLAGLLTDFLSGQHDQRLITGAACLLLPPDPGLSHREQAAYYLANANHRLLHLGLLNRGDGMRRRTIPFGLTEDESRQRDLGVGACCYRLAANLLKGRNLVSGGLESVLEKLADNFEDYVQVLAVMATRKLGLGARLSDLDRAKLLEGADQLLDLINQFGNTPAPEVERSLRAAARRVGADAETILSGLRRT